MHGSPATLDAPAAKSHVKMQVGGPRCTVAIPTFRRPERLRAAIASVRDQVGFDDYEILVIDNSPEGSAADIVKAFPCNAPPLRYVHETNSGPAHARNRAVAEARGELLAFLDDDETACSTWLRGLISVLEAKSADAAFGKVEASMDLAPRRHRPYAARLYTRAFKAESGADLRHRHVSLGAGNSIFRVSACFGEAEPFPLKMAAVGGEDSLFLRRLVKSGRRLVWAPEAVVQEHLPVERVQPESLRARRYRQGQLRTMACLVGPRPDPLGVLVWMAVGAVQIISHSLAWLVSSLLGQGEDAERAGFGIAGGLGKITWWTVSSTAYGPSCSYESPRGLQPKTQNFSQH